MASSSRDPFNIDLLADDLALRDSNKSDSIQDHDLPLFVPLAHSNEYLTAPEFALDDFLLSRAHESLPDLRAELREYLGALKEELVRLINDDYEAFISLSTDLKGEGVRLQRLKWPLAGLKEQALLSKQELQLIQDAIQGKLRMRATIREEKALLHLLLKISESITRLESLLLIEGPSSPAPIPEDNRSHAKHLARAAAEYTQLLYHASKARAETCAFVDEVQWRIDRIRSTLSADLDHLFARTLVDTSSSRSGDAPPARSARPRTTDADLAECLRTYEMLGLWREAEDVLRREIVRPFVKKTIFPGALTTPHSPLLPQTPGLAVRAPRTPYTPFTAFASKQDPARAPMAIPVPLLDDTNDPLAGLYNILLRWAAREVVPTVEAAERARVEEHGDGFEVMANVVWAECGRAIMDELGGVVFAAGRPDEFRKHYETTQAFVRALEVLAPSARAVVAMRAHPVHAAFMRRWQLPVYFQLRWKTAVGRVEEALAVTSLTDNGTGGFASAQAEAIWTAIAGCWSAEIYIPELGHRFWRFTLQLLSRYKTWLHSSILAVEALQPKPLALLTSEKASTSPSISRAATPAPPSEATSAENTAADDTSIRQCAAAIVDIRAMESHVLALWREEISVVLPETPDNPDDDAIPTFDALQHTLSGVTSLVDPLSGRIATVLARRACDSLLPVRSVPSQFRAMAGKRAAPTEPSYFVAGILRPIRAFFGIGTGGEAYGASLKEAFMKRYAEEVFEVVCQRYIYYLTAMRKTEESLRRLKKGQTSTFSLFGKSNSGKEDDRQDEERIRTQMILDVNALGKDAEGLSVDILASDAFKSLRDMVHATVAEANER
ncbi:hypothetical protein PLICRDRAFT_172529 [Plicaturopsis crispa FD-325 SS-3]|nr:hypothetical protein PLICRDRAFT_172529 [Plicaturopsis crispa FD-325 SS-3]